MLPYHPMIVRVIFNGLLLSIIKVSSTLMNDGMMGEVGEMIDCKKDDRV
jgi:hypothetical protein